MKYKFSDQVVSVKEGNTWIVFNWLNLQYFLVTDNRHPLYLHFEKNIDEFNISTLNSFPDTCRYLIDKLFLVTSQNDILKYISGLLDEFSCNQNELSLILLPANQACNFSCVYCYENHQANNLMCETDEELILDLIKSRTPTRLHVEYFGGEPLLNKAFITSLNKKIITLKDRWPLKFTSSITTNGYLLDVETYKSLSNLNVSHFQITLDGLKSDHDSLRPFKNGGGTFDNIIHNLKQLADMDLGDSYITVRVNYNINSMTKSKMLLFNSAVLSPLTRNKNIHVIFKPISSMGEEKLINSKNICTEKAFYEIELNLSQLLQNETNYIGTIISYLRKTYFCYAARANSLLLFPAENGDMKIGKCTVKLTDPINRVGILKKGGNIVLNRNYSKWVTKINDINKKCLSCFFLTQCFSSACPSQNIISKDAICPRIIWTREELTQSIVSSLNLVNSTK